MSSDEDSNSTNALQDWFSRWQQGAPQQTAVVESACSFADAHRHELWAPIMVAWLGAQLGEPGLRRVQPYVVRATDAGVGWAAMNAIAAAVSNWASWPDIAASYMPSLERVSPYAMAIDPAGTAWGLLSQGKPGDALAFLRGAVTPRVFAAGTPEEIEQVVHQLEISVERVRRLERSSESLAAKSSERAAAAQQQMEEIEKKLLTRAQQTELLIDTVASGAVNQRFEDEAAANEAEGKSLFRWGIAVLVLAAMFAVMPLGVHYLGYGPDFTSTGLLAAHTAVTVAFAAVAGVLLARARSRDRARQRARDLSTAMGTVIAYSNQIEDPAEKQRFLQTMGQLVLVAHLQADKAGDDQVSIGLSSILAAVKAPPPQ